jgi:uncharacterized protein YciI
MPQFLVLAYDGTDAEALERRRSVRGTHFESIKPMIERNEIRAAGAILDDAGNMVGSVLLMEFPSRLDLDAWLKREPYATQGVWQRIDVRPFRVAVLDGKVTR